MRLHFRKIPLLFTLAIIVVLTITSLNSNAKILPGDDDCHPIYGCTDGGSGDYRNITVGDYNTISTTTYNLELGISYYRIYAPSTGYYNIKIYSDSNYYPTGAFLLDSNFNNISFVQIKNGLIDFGDRLINSSSVNYIKFDNTANYTGQLTFKVFRNDDNISEKPKTIPLGSTIYSSINYYLDTDYYDYTATRDAYIKFTFSYGPSTTIVCNGYSVTPNPYLQVKTGDKCRIIIGGNNNFEGNYNLRLDYIYSDYEGNSIDNSKSVTLNAENYYNNILAKSDMINDKDYFMIYPQVNGRISIETTGNVNVSFYNKYTEEKLDLKDEQIYAEVPYYIEITGLSIGDYNLYLFFIENSNDTIHVTQDIITPEDRPDKAVWMSNIYKKTVIAPGEITEDRLIQYNLLTNVNYSAYDVYFFTEEALNNELLFLESLLDKAHNLNNARIESVEIVEGIQTGVSIAKVAIKIIGVTNPIVGTGLLLVDGSLLLYNYISDGQYLADIIDDLEDAIGRLNELKASFVDGKTVGIMQVKFSFSSLIALHTIYNHPLNTLYTYYQKDKSYTYVGDEVYRLSIFEDGKDYNGTEYEHTTPQIAVSPSGVTYYNDGGTFEFFYNNE